MKIDEVSSAVIILALYLDSKIPESISSHWIEENVYKALEKQIPTDSNLAQHRNTVSGLVDQVGSARRKQYLREIVQSINYQIDTADSWEGYEIFSKQCFGFKIPRADQSELDHIESQIQALEKKLGGSRYDIFRKHKTANKDYKQSLQTHIDSAKKKLPRFMLDFPDKGYEIKVVSDKPWSMFNYHYKPYASRLSINGDISFNSFNFFDLAFHEMYAGHHSELSHKDKLLLDEGRGEHGLIVTLSPQVFVSEGIAEAVYVLLGHLENAGDEYVLAWHYNRLMFAVQNIATYMFFDDSMSREKIRSEFEGVGLTPETLDAALNFSTDKLYGKYSAVYYSAFGFIEKLYKTSSNKEKLLQTLFTKPCTPNMLLDKQE